MSTTQDRRRARWMENFQVVAALATALATMFSAVAAYAAIKSAIFSQQQLAASTRPWLAVDDPKIRLIPQAANPDASFTLKNYGQGATTSVRFSFYVLYVKPEDYSDNRIAQMLTASDRQADGVDFGTLAPGQSSPFYTTPGGLQKIGLQSTAGPGQRSARFMRLLFQYKGTDGQTHHTYVCYDLGWEPEPLTSISHCTIGESMD